MGIKNLYPIVVVETGKTLATFDDPAEAAAAVEGYDEDCRALVRLADFEALSIKAMVTAYNVLSVRSVKTFETKAVGISRLRRFLQPNSFTYAGRTVRVEPEKEMVMATSTPKKKAAPPKKAAAKKKVATKKAAKTTTRLKTATEAGFKNASQMFRQLISDGKLTDDEIFAQVQKAFSLDDSKRRYVAWYRKDLARRA